MMPKNVFKKLYEELKRKHGKPSGQWQLWCKRPKSGKEKEKVIIGAILTQRTNWKNVELAMENLKKENKCSLRGVLSLTPEKLGLLIKSSGFFKTKTRYLLNLAKYIVKNHKSVGQMEKQGTGELRENLLKLKGIGPETADSILLYGLQKPVFVIDEYTRRLMRKRKLSQNLSYDFLQKLFEKNLKRDFKLYQDFHALIVIDGKYKNNSN